MTDATLMANVLQQHPKFVPGSLVCDARLSWNRPRRVLSCEMTRHVKGGGSSYKLVTEDTKESDFFSNHEYSCLSEWNCQPEEWADKRIEFLSSEVAMHHKAIERLEEEALNLKTLKLESTPL